MNKKIKEYLDHLNSKYQDVVLKDVQNVHYSRSTVWFLRLYTFFLTVFMVVYALFFHRFIVRNFAVFVDLHENAFTTTTHPAIRILVYKYEYFIYFLIFLFLFSLFLGLGFFAYDFHQRNALIAKLIRKSANFSKEHI